MLQYSLTPSMNRNLRNTPFMLLRHHLSEEFQHLEALLLMLLVKGRQLADYHLLGQQSIRRKSCGIVLLFLDLAFLRITCFQSSSIRKEILPPKLMIILRLVTRKYDISSSCCCPYCLKINQLSHHSYSITKNNPCPIIKISTVFLT